MAARGLVHSVGARTLIQQQLVGKEMAKKLFYYSGNASMAPHFVLEEIGQSFELASVQRTQDKHKSPEYLKFNPNGLIPVLVDGDLVLYETAAICLHLADTHPEMRLAPELGAPERARFYTRRPN